MSEEQKDIVWNVTRACFWLLSSIIWAQIVMSFTLTLFCFYGIATSLIPAGGCKDFAPNIMELLVGGMAVVIAFSGRGSK
jgi:hypothetical protein